MALFQIIKWDAEPGYVAYRYPNDRIRLGSELFVSETQQAILLKAGKLITVFEPGRHVLATWNIPLVDWAVNLPFGGDTPFPVDVWFVNKTTKLDIFWGTPAPLMLRDPQYNVLLPIRANGQFGVTVADAKEFMVKLVGTLPDFTYESIRSYFKAIVLTKASDLIGKFIQEMHVGAFEIPSHLDELSGMIESSLKDAFAEFGILLSHFKVQSLTVASDAPGVKGVEDALAAKAQMEILGKDYEMKRRLDIMEKAAENQNGMTGGVMGAGIGFGLGSSMAKEMAESLSGGMQSCPHCGKTCKAIYSFCPGCGGKIR